MVRCVTDAFLDDDGEIFADSSPVEVDTRDGGVDEVSDLFSGLSMHRQERSRIKILHGGVEIPQDRLVELSTRSERNAGNYNWEDHYPQYLLSQTRHHFLGVHQRGEFLRIDEHTLGDPEMEEIEEAAQAGLRKLKVLLTSIQDMVITHGRGVRLSLISENRELKVYERESQGDCLPVEMMARFR